MEGKIKTMNKRTNKVNAILEGLDSKRISPEHQRIIKKRKNELDLFDMYGELKDSGINIFTDPDDTELSPKQIKLVKDSIMNWVYRFVEALEDEPEEVFKSAYFRNRVIDSEKAIRPLEFHVSKIKTLSDLRDVAGDLEIEED